MKRYSLHQVDMGLGAIFVALALFVLVQSLQLDFYVESVPGPGFFPTLLAIALAIAGSILTVTSFLGRKDSEEDFDAPTRAQVKRSLSVWLAVLVRSCWFRSSVSFCRCCFWQRLSSWVWSARGTLPASPR